MRSFPGGRPLISRGVLRELSAAAANKGSKGASAKAALALVRKRRVNIAVDSGHVDAWISVAAARYKNSIVVTNDTALFRKLRGSGKKVFRLSRSGILKQ